MSGPDGWGNQVGTAAYATTPSGSIPQYGLGLDAGTAFWTDRQTFKAFVEDAVARNRTEVQQVEQKKQQDDTGWFQKALGGVGGALGAAGGFLSEGVGFIAGGPLQDTNRADLREKGSQTLGTLTPDWIGPALHTVYRGLATPFVASQQAYKMDGWWLTDPSDWSQAWQLSEERTPGQAFVDWVLQGEDPRKSQKNLDRLKRTSSLYGLTSFAADLAIGWRLDPTVIGAKGLGEARRIRAGEMPRQVEVPSVIPGRAKKAGTAYPNAVRGYLGEERLGNTPGARYGYWRGQRIARNLDELRTAAQEMTPGDFANMPMFRRRNASNGAAAAELFQIAAQDDRLWDLTARAMMPDPKAWAEIQLMKDGVDPLIPEDALNAAIRVGEKRPDQRTYLDALDAQKSKFDKLDKEVQDLERVLSTRVPGKGGFYEFYTKELHATYESRVADLQELEQKLGQYNDHKAWLDGIVVKTEEGGLGPGASLNVVKVKPASFDYLSQRNYQKSLWGPVHTLHEITKAGWLKAANPIELNRVDTGAQAIRRQFEQMQHELGYVAAPGAIDATLKEFTRLSMAGDTYNAAQLVRRMEATHLVEGLAQRHGLSREVVTDFLNTIRSKQGDMIGKLLSGDGAIYTTAPGQGARLVRKAGEDYIVEVTEGARRHTIKVPAAAFEGMKETADLAQDIVQTPNYYTPLSVRQLHLAIKRDADLFAELESGLKNFGRDWLGKTMNTIDAAGGRWNRFWKPLQLFRLAWPQRVLMDEGLRGMAMLGVSSWMNNYGAAFYNASINAFNPYHHPVFGPTLAGAATGMLAAGPAGAALGGIMAGATGSFLKRRSLRIGPGPIADELTGRVGATEAHIPEDIPSVPTRFAAKRNAKRADALGRQVAHIQQIRKTNIRAAALQRAAAEQNSAVFGRVTAMTRGQQMPHVPASPRHVDLEDWGPKTPLPYRTPAHLALDEFRVRQTRKTAAGTLNSPREVVDPLTGKQVKSGYAVPVASKELRRTPGELRSGVRTDYAAQHVGAEEHDLGDFIAANQDLLSSGGYRLMFEKGRQIGDPIVAHVVRVFNTKESQVAVEFSQHVQADRFINIHQGHSEYVRDWSAKSPIMEALDRQFAPEEGVEFTPGTSPAKGVPPVYHGSDSGLPDELLPREQAPMLRGNMFGQGFYTTASKDIAESYSTEGLYTIRGSKTGKTYKVFDLEKRLTKKDIEEFRAFGDEWVARKAAELRNQGSISPAEDLEHNWRALRNDAYIAGLGPATWVKLFMNHAPWADDVARVDKIITEFLEQKRNAGALTHIGGVFTGGDRHQVYIWLHPEDLNVRPAYDKSGRWYSLEEWFDNPESQEQLLNPVPESRIHRVGKKPNARARQANENLAATEEGVAQGDYLDGLNFDSWLKETHDSVHERFIRRLKKRRQLGRGHVKFTAADGSKIVAPAAFEGPGEIYEALVSGAPAYARLTDTYKRTLSMAQHKAVGYKRILPPDLSEGVLRTRAGRQAAGEYYAAWADLLNDQIRNSPIWYKMLEGQSDEQIMSWLNSTSEGARLRKTLPHKGYDPERWVEEHRQALDFYLPRNDLQALLRERRLDPSDLRRIGREDMPEIYGPDLEMIEGSSPLGNWWGRQVEKIYTALGTTPTDKLSRQPFFKGMYDLRMANLMKSVDPELLTDDIVRGFSKESREFALRQVRKTMYELGDDTNMTEALRFLAPFWGAQQEAILKWMSIAIERPETVARFYLGTGQAYDRLTIIDEDGNPVEGPDGEWKGFGYNPNHRINFQVPKWLANKEPFKTLLAGQDNLRTSFGSLNTALQGDKPFLPSLGPVLSVPADVFINALWDTHGTEFDDNFFYRWLFPIGRPASGLEGKLDYIMPGWGRRLEQLRQGMDARTYANTWYSVQREMMLDAEKRGAPPPTNEEVQKAVNWHFALRTIVSFGGPVAVEFAPKHQFYLDEYHRMQQQWGPAMAFEKFVKKYGADAARFAASSSESVGVPPTALGMKEWKSNDKLIQALHEAGQDDLISAVISPDAWADDFSSDAYSAQFDIKLGPGTKDTLRDTTSAAQRNAITDARLGWIEYRRLSAAINADLYANGYTSTQQSGAGWIADKKAAKVQEIAQKYPAWYDQYNNFSNTIYSRVNALREFVADKRFDNRPDIQGVRQYLVIRDQVAQELERYHAETGGSRNLQSQENTPLRTWFYQQVGQLVMDNPAFGEFYSRYLDSDSLERGAG